MSENTRNVKDVISDYKNVITKENTLKLASDAKSAVTDIKDKIINLKGFQNFFRSTLSGLVYVSLYFYFGSSLFLLCKNAQKSEAGLDGQEMDGAPYIGKFDECKDATLDFFSTNKWAFPYKNAIICNKDYNINKPLLFRYVSWVTTVMAFSYSFGRKILNTVLSIDQNIAMLLGPIIMIFILLATPFGSYALNLAGCLIHAVKLLPSCIFSFWFPLSTMFLFVTTTFMFPSIMAMVQTTHIFSYFMYPTFGKLEFKENGFNKKTKGFISVFYTMLKSSVYLLSLFILVSYNAIYHLESVISIPLVILSVILVYFKFFV